MKRQRHSNPSVIRTLRYTLAASVVALAMGVSAGEGSAVTITANSLSAAATVSQVSSIELRVAGPGGFRASQQSETGALDWYPSDLVDGEYRYEVFVTVGDKPAEGAADTTQLYRENGRFKVENGTISPLEEAVMPPLPNIDDQTSLEPSSWYEKLATGVLDFLVPPATAANLTTNPGDVYITDVTPNIYWDDSDVAGADWHTFASSTNYGVYDVTNAKYLFLGVKDPSFRMYDMITAFYLWGRDAGGYSFFIDQAAGLDVFRADSNGDIELADGSVFIDKSTNYLGVGTVTPSEDIHVVSSTPALLLDSTGYDIVRMANSYGELGFYRSGGSYNGYVLTLENDLGSALYPGVGIWETDPEVPLHVGSHDHMSAEVLVENPTAPTAAGDVVMFNLRNTGDKIVRFAIQAGGGTSIWTFDNEPTYNGGAGINSGRFRVAKSGTGVTEFSVDGYGNGRFYGNSYAVNHVNTSSRESKTDFVALNEQDVLARLMQLPVSEWRYKQEHQGSRHIGPVAEDFQRTFGLGDGKHISTVDSEGIALAAIKAVKAEKDVEVTALKRERDAKLAALSAEKDAEIAALVAERDNKIAALKTEKDTEIAALKAERDVEIAGLKAERDAKIAALSERVQALEELLVGQQQVSAR